MGKLFKKVFKFLIIIIIIISFFVSGYYDYMREISFDEFTYPLEENIKEYVELIKMTNEYPRTIINEYKYDYIINPSEKCGNENIHLVLVIKSSMRHFERRQAIRQTWGDEGQFAGVQMRRFFMLGNGNNNLLSKAIQMESDEYKDIIQGDFIDAYYNNTIKTMMSYKWLLKNCFKANFYMFVDDDYYVSIVNALNYIRNPFNYPKYLNDLKANSSNFDLQYFYSGNCIRRRPMRDYFSKYRLSLNEYPFNEFPIFSTAGAYILSRNALEELYYASFYTKHFRFDDVYLGILSRKLGVQPIHSQYIVGEWREDDADFKQYCIASHGFDDTNKMIQLWKSQKELGYS